MIINHNITALNTHRQLSSAFGAQSKSMEKLASGLRINKAGDDAAGLAISEKMRSQIRGLDQASANAQDGISMIATAEGALNETHDILQRMRELATQSSNGTITNDDRKAIQDEVKQLKEEVDRIGNTTEFNTQKLLSGNLKSAGGATVGQNTTSGAIVATQTAGKLSGAITNASAFTKETITVDGASIDVDWQDLTSEEQNILKNAATDANTKQAAAELIGQKINEAIDASGLNVAHVNAYSDGTNLVIESGTTGTKSKVDDGGGLLNTMTATATGTAGTSTYNGTTIADASTFKMDINGVTMEVTAGGTGAYANGEDMSDVATQLQTDLNTAIAAANLTSGATTSADAGFIKDVVVKATEDGKFEINSESGPVKFLDTPGSTSVKDLGLSQAQTDASGNGGMTFQIGANKGQTITLGVNDMRSAALGIAGIDVSSQAGASNALESLDKAIKTVSSERSKLGAVQNRLEHTINNLNTSSENLTAAESRIRDVDYALAA
ncbi:flagellin [Sporosarcina sp. P13]|uniref:flagellin N-terminal helical domain-containing protein n=1 Tax=Sporosarcina sp. P13 TaxID=2048263 RepID=UPI000C165674|nr:flagellin [Sporosarcina sp. P13]PIC62952.1 flagellin [Sporosarcina sp. P13]